MILSRSGVIASSFPVSLGQDYQFFSSVTVTTATNNVTFASIPQTHYDLRLVFSALNDVNTVSGTSDIWLNGNDSARGPWIAFSGNDSAVWDTVTGVDTTRFDIAMRANQISSNALYSGVLDLAGYTRTAYTKPYVLQHQHLNGTTVSRSAVYTGMFNTNSAITSVSFSTSSVTGIQPGSKFTLYGIGAQ